MVLMSVSNNKLLYVFMDVDKLAGYACLSKNLMIFFFFFCQLASIVYKTIYPGEIIYFIYLFLSIYFTFRFFFQYRVTK